MIRNTWMYLNALIGNKKGQSMVEYGIIIALIAVIAMVSIPTIGTQVAKAFADLVGKF